ncbi:MAG TPA: molybdopterin cofactor-binding domain-containing protein, partial [Longimicrobium sp.]|nr:molybdopterin cofactor-binding domain-containing protein [Longimicrobium sp.]
MSKLTFWLNGQETTIDQPSTATMLIDYLRSPEVGLSGPKKPCGQGGCGGCTVILSDWDTEEDRPHHRAINACLHPLVALNGQVVTTVEGTGSTKAAAPRFLSHVPSYFRSAMPAEEELPPAVAEAQEAAAAKNDARVQEADAAPLPAAAPGKNLEEDAPDWGMNPVAYRLALNNGSQCGYCSVGFVMNMSDFFVNNPNATQREIEDAMDGNLCRCTGYRPILTGMKTFASNWTEEDEENRMKCKLDPGQRVQLPSDVVAIPFPPAARATPQPLSLDDGGRAWLAPTSLDELLGIMREHDPATTFLNLANTGYGIYPAEYDRARTLVDLSFIPELGEPPRMDGDVMRVPAATSYTDLIAVLGEEAWAPRPHQDVETTAFGALRFMARRTAGRIVRNAASLGGNTMLVLKHIASGTGAPFPSDALTALAAVGAEIEYLETESEGPLRASVTKLVERVVKDPGLAHRLVIVAYHIPRGGADDVVLAQKVAMREVNSHSLVNATTRLAIGSDRTVREAELVFGNIAPYPWHARDTAALMVGQTLWLEAFPALANQLIEEVEAELDRWKERHAELPYDGLSPSYQVQLAVSMLYKAIVNALEVRGAKVPPPIQSAGEITWGRWPVSEGRQTSETLEFRAPVGQSYIKLTAMAQASGKIHYTHETPITPKTVEGVFVQSRRALANFTLGLPGKKAPSNAEAGLAALRAHLAERFSGFVALVASDAFNPRKGMINYQGMGGDQPIFAETQVEYVGQSIALAVGRTFDEAREIAEYVEGGCVHYTDVTVKPGNPAWWAQPVLSIDQALEVGSIYPDWPKTASFVGHIWQLTRPGSQLQWVEEKDPLDKEPRVRPGTVDGVPVQIVESTQTVGGQKHFYMETQAAIVTPTDSDHYDAVISTQSPMEMHQSIAMALGLQYSQITVRVPSVGGAFGGKTGISGFVAAAAAVAARQTRLPVRVALTREQDSAMFGKRHPYYAQWQIAIDPGEADPARKGIIRGLVNRMWGDGGAFYDCSFIVSDCIMTRADNAYRIDNWQAQIDVCRTNTAPSTAMRAFGDIQSKIMFESAIEDAAFSIGMRPEEVRGLNLYQRGDVTPFGQSQPYCYMSDVWKYLKDKCGYEARMAEVQAFNAANRWRKRGLAMIPVKYASGYNLTMLEQAAAVASVYKADGSVVINQGGVESGQGLLTQAQQVAAYVLNLPMEMIDIRDPTTAVIPNPSSTGASTGTTYAAEATKRVCEKLRSRLTEFGYQLLKEQGDEWCRKQGVDFWNYGVAGWSTVLPPSTPDATGKLIWQNLVSHAYSQRISLVAAITEALPGGEQPATGITFKPADLQPNIPGYVSNGKGSEEVDQFMGFTYSAACSVVEVDILTGEAKVIRSDLAYDIGWSLNPALDVGQVEGAFVQGIGYLMSEKLEVEPSGPDAGRLNTLNTWEYKIPSTTSIPLEFNVHLFPRSLAKDVPDSPFERPFSSKEVGEPPLVLSATVFFAIKDAIRASRLERGLDPLF